MGLPQVQGEAGPCLVQTPKPGLPGKNQPLPAQLTQGKW